MSEQNPEIEAVRALHRSVQWRGWRLWMLRLAHEPLAYYDTWCRECRKPWPCPTERATTPTGGEG